MNPYPFIFFLIIQFDYANPFEREIIERYISLMEEW